MKEQESLVQVKNLKTHFFTEEGVVKAVDGVDFEIFSGETLGIVGESGCGKSVTALSIMGLVESPPGEIVEGEINFAGQDLTELSEDEMRKIRGNDIAMIFQEPMTSLNPVYTVGDQISESLILHENLSKEEARDRAIELLKRVGIPLPGQRVDEYPHQLSGGMRQRVMIAMALSCDPKLLIADEPTTALDVTIQAQILELLQDLEKDFGMSIMMITHDLGVIAEISHRIAVMYAGKVMEYTTVENLYNNPSHPYTWGLMRSIPKIHENVEELEAIPGVVPSPLDFPEGCKFNSRCFMAEDKCFEKEPPLRDLNDEHKSRCWYIDKLKKKQSKFQSA